MSLDVASRCKQMYISLKSGLSHSHHPTSFPSYNFQVQLFWCKAISISFPALLVYELDSVKVFFFFWIKQDLIIAMAALKRQMKKLRRARRLRDKAKECEMLKRKKQSMLAKQAADQKLIDVFTLFIEAIGRNDAENAQKLAEKAMMCAILNMMNGNTNTSSGNNGGFSADDAKKEA
ncbi:hypothetical protein V6N13_066793 [Hibiscus sabdariffa]|uniref:Uncharacterized protein n=1 Tax=Hibiscus sabdariffa TaxID=183260 RepID=A0ABR2DRI3_9ROSI